MHPEFSGSGLPTEYQISREITVIFHELLKGWGLPYQLQRFCWAVYSTCKPGQTFNWNDGHFARLLGRDGSTSKNYICKLRRHLKEWQSGYYEDNDQDDRTGPHPVIISVLENEYNSKLKTQTPTGYVFSVEFDAHLKRIAQQVRASAYYKENWLKAIHETLDRNRKSLSEFGVWRQRKQKRPRDPEKVAGTLWLCWEKASERLIEFYAEQGFKANWIAAEMANRFPTMVRKHMAGAVLSFKPRVNVYTPLGMMVDSFIVPGSKEDFDGFQKLVNAYLDMRNNKGEYTNDAGRSVQQLTFERPGRNTDPGAVHVPAILDDSALTESLQKISSNQSVDTARNRFLRGNKKRE
jgi:hypothetical protein